MLALGLITGLVLGALLMNLAVEEERNTNSLLKIRINTLEDDVDLANLRVENRNRLINDLQEEHEILLTNASEQRIKITDLNNNIELLVNNLSKQNKELVDLPKSN